MKQIKIKKEYYEILAGYGLMDFITLVHINKEIAVIQRIVTKTLLPIFEDLKAKSELSDVEMDLIIDIESALSEEFNVTFYI